MVRLMARALGNHLAGWVMSARCLRCGSRLLLLVLLLLLCLLLLLPSPPLPLLLLALLLLLLALAPDCVRSAQLQVSSCMPVLQQQD